MPITASEAHVIKAIARHEMSPSNGARPTEVAEAYTFCWAEDFAPEGMNVQQVKGVLSSLVQKGLIAIQPYDERDKTVHLTELGFKVYNEEVDPV